MTDERPPLLPTEAGSEWAASRWLAAFGLSVGTYLALFLFFTTAYETNDDVGMMALASGLFRTEASPFLLFTHISIGYALEALYAWAPDFPWYAAYLYSVQVLAWTLVLHALLTLYRPREALLFFLAIFAMIGAHVAMKIQFTSTSILLGSASAFYFVSMVHRSRPRALPVAMGALLAAAGLIRENSLYLVLALWTPLLVYVAVRISARSVVLLVGTVAALSLLASATTFLAYDTDPRWEQYREFNRVRGQLQGRANFKPSAEARRKVEWTPSDTLLFRRWLFADPEVYSVDKLQLLHEDLGQKRSEFPTLLIRRSLYFVESQLIGTALVLLFLSAWTRPTRAALVFANLAWVLGLFLAAVVVFARMPTRVSIPMLLSTVLSSVFIAGLPRVEWGKPGRPRLVFAVSLVLMALCAARVGMDVVAWNEESQRHLERDRTVRALYDQLATSYPGSVLIHWPPAIRTEWLSPFARLSDLPPLRIVWLGWQTQSPDWVDELTANGIQDLYASLAHEDHVYLVTSPVRPRLVTGALAEFLQHRRGVSVDFDRECLDDSCSVLVWTAQPEAPGEQGKPRRPVNRLGRFDGRGRRPTSGP